MTARTIDRKTSERPLTGRGVLLILLAFFGTVGAVNFYMARMALSTFSGEVIEHPYESGLAYNRDIAAARAQDTLGWKVSADIGAVVDGRAEVMVAAVDAGGNALPGLSVQVMLQSPVAHGYDTAALLSPTGNGTYRGSLAARPGLWELVIDARDPVADKRFLSQSRMTLK